MGEVADMYTQDGTVDMKGNPAVKKGTGNWRACPYILANECCERLATSGANFARAYTVEFGSCQFPYNFTGCQDLAKQKKVPFISDDLEIECEGKEKYKCGSNVFWKW